MLQLQQSLPIVPVRWASAELVLRGVFKKHWFYFISDNISISMNIMCVFSRRVGALQICIIIIIIIIIIKATTWGRDDGHELVLRGGV